MSEEETISLSTLQFAWGGLLGSRPADGLAHLVRRTRRGTPGPTLCGIDRFAKGTPDWFVGGGISGPDITHAPCKGCAAVARDTYPHLKINGLAAEQFTVDEGGGEGMMTCKSTRVGFQCTELQHELFESEPVHQAVVDGVWKRTWIDNDTPHWIARRSDEQ